MPGHTEISGTVEKLKIGGTIEAVELETRNTVYVRENKVAAVMKLGDDGPARFWFVCGGYIDVCGSAEIWALKLRIAEIQDHAPSDQKKG